MKKRKLTNNIWKKKITKYSIISLAVLAPALVVTPIVALTLNQKSADNGVFYLFFDNKVFDSKNDLDKYLDQKISLSSFTADAVNYSYDNEIFTSYEDFIDYLRIKFEPTSIQTNKYSKEYVLNSSGELSENILMNKDSRPVKVYQGRNKIAYTDIVKAKDSLRTFKKVYIKPDLKQESDDKSKELKNLNEASYYETLKDAKDAIRNEILVKGKDSNEDPEILYQNGTTYQTKNEIKAWIMKNIKRGFEYNGRVFSDHNYDEFLNYFSYAKEHIINENILPIVNADKKTYWLNLDSEKNPGYFIGPKYIETITKLPENLSSGFIEVESHDRGFIDGALNAILLDAVIGNNYSVARSNEEALFNWNSNNRKKPIFYDFLKYLSEEGKVISNDFFLKLEKELFPVISKENDNTKTELTYLEKLLTESTNNLIDIKDNEFTDIHKMLVAMKRTLTSMKIYANFTTNDIEKVEALFKELTLKVITNDEAKDDNGNPFYNLNYNLADVGFFDLADIFLNPGNFYKNNSEATKIMNIFSMIRVGIEGVKNITSVGISGADLKNDFKEYNKKRRERKIEANKTKEMKSAFNKNVSDAIAKDPSVNKKLGIKDGPKTTTFIGPLLLIAKVVSLILELNDLLSIFTYKTYEYKIDEYQSLFYYGTALKIPFTSYTTDAKPQRVYPVKISDSIVDFMLPNTIEDNGNRVSQVYEFAGKYYFNKQNAIEALKSDIFLHPEWYIEAKNLLVGMFKRETGYILPDGFKISRDGTGLSSAEYHLKLQEEIEKYAEELFNEYYPESKIVRRYRDGFGNDFPTWIEAWESANDRVYALNDSEIEKWAWYAYDSNMEGRIVRRTESELNAYINQEEIISEKIVNSDDLIKTANYDDLNEYSEVYQKIYKVTLYGQNKYFATSADLWKHIFNTIEYSVDSYLFKQEEYEYNNYTFKSKEEYEYWIAKNTFFINEKDLKGREIIKYEND